MPSYLEVSCDCPAEAAEQVCFYIIENLASGVITEDADNRVIIRFYLMQDEQSQALLQSFKQHLVVTKAILPKELETMVTAKSADQTDWLTAYQQQFGSVIVDDIVIKPSWESQDYPDKLVILMDPKMAFGTGRHETTQLCLRQVRDDLRPGDRVLDFGCGSGVLAILAAKLGASEVVGIDIDPEATENAQENITLNEVDDKLSVRLGSIEQVREQGHYDLVVSNLIFEGLLEFYDQLAAAAKPDSVLLLSGIMDAQEEAFVEFLKSVGENSISVTRLNEWICVRVARGDR